MECDGSDRQPAREAPGRVEPEKPQSIQQRSVHRKSETEALTLKITVLRRRNRVGVRKSTPVGTRESGKYLNVFVQDKSDRITVTDEK